MCGIAAIVSLTGRPLRDAEARIGAMMKAMRHRGPDQQGAYVSPDRLVALGNTRLAIVDVRNHFQVPMRAADGGAALTYNGEIFNYRDERARLEGKGCRFLTHSDTEVLLNGLCVDGPEFLDRLDGFWSFVLYRPDCRRVLVGRDLLGEKHTFYRIDHGELIVASEVAPLLAVGAARNTLDSASVVSSFQFRAAPPGRTLIDGVHRLEAGMNLELIAGTDAIRRYRGRRLRPEKWRDFFAAGPSEDAVIDLYEKAIGEACRMRVPDEVEYMTTLSGGLDSALVNVFTSDFGRRRLHSLYGSTSRKPPRKGADLDELAASRFTAGKLNTYHDVIDLVSDDCVPLYRAQARNSFDGLFCEGVVAYQQLARHVASATGRVLIMSDGPDELLGGYDVDRAALLFDESLRHRPLRRAALRCLAGHPWGRRVLPEQSRAPVVNWRELSAQPFHFRPVHGGTTPDVMESLFPGDLAYHSTKYFGDIPADYGELAQSLDLSQRMALSYATRSLPDYFNLRSDRGSMAESVELRLPFQSPTLVELMIATPERWRYYGGQSSKHVFRRLVDRYVGPEIAYRGKYGFAHPAWMVPEIERALDLRGTIAGSGIFDDLPFKPGARDFLLRPDQQRHQWMAYCLALVHDRLTSGEFSASVERGTMPEAVEPMAVSS
jgi:asparagine synthase (glutamine-hydrolysing)